jgi:hypothetical protein
MARRKSNGDDGPSVIHVNRLQRELDDTHRLLKENTAKLRQALEACEERDVEIVSLKSVLQTVRDLSEARLRPPLAQIQAELQRRSAEAV